MVSVSSNPAQGFCLFDSMNTGIPDVNSLPAVTVAAAASAVLPANSVSAAGGSNTMSFEEDPSKKTRKPYTITKSRESWSEQEHDKFLEALQLFDRDWKKIEAFVGSKSVIQIRSHAQKYFLKVQKNGTSEHVPPPRPKRKAGHPYPQKAPKTGYMCGPDSSFVLGNPVATSWRYNSIAAASMSQGIKNEEGLSAQIVSDSWCYSTCNESTPRGRKLADPTVPVMPDFSQVYSFIGSVFDPNSTGHLERLRQMDPINLETALLLMRNLSLNLASPEFEHYRKWLSSYTANSKMGKFATANDKIHMGKQDTAIESI